MGHERSVYSVWPSDGSLRLLAAPDLAKLSDRMAERSPDRGAIRWEETLQAAINMPGKVGSAVQRLL